MDALSIAISPFNLLRISSLLSLPLAYNKLSGKQQQETCDDYVSQESRKTTATAEKKKKIVAPAAGPAGSRFNDWLDRRRCRGRFTSTAARIERAEPPKQRSAAKLLQGKCRSGSGLTMRCDEMQCDRRCASARDKTNRPRKNKRSGELR